MHPIFGPIWRCSAQGCRYFLQPQEAGAEYAGLGPGRLTPEIRKALGIKATAPPPWLQQMRQLGIPPDYRAKTAGEHVTRPPCAAGVLAVGDPSASLR